MPQNSPVITFHDPRLFFEDFLFKSPLMMPKCTLHSVTFSEDKRMEISASLNVSGCLNLWTWDWTNCDTHARKNYDRYRNTHSRSNESFADTASTLFTICFSLTKRSGKQKLYMEIKVATIRKWNEWKKQISTWRYRNTRENGLLPGQKWIHIHVSHM